MQTLLQPFLYFKKSSRADSKEFKVKSEKFKVKSLKFKVTQMARMTQI